VIRQLEHGAQETLNFGMGIQIGSCPLRPKGQQALGRNLCAWIGCAAILVRNDIAELSLEFFVCSTGTSVSELIAALFRVVGTAVHGIFEVAIEPNLHHLFLELGLGLLESTRRDGASAFWPVLELRVREFAKNVLCPMSVVWRRKPIQYQVST
jgi:hypothetical protein